ncbi:MAG: hypothetical protein WBB45_09155 [Cyclobacteriaceae bacterium]
MRLAKCLAVLLLFVISACSKSNNSFTSFGGDSQFQMDAPSAKDPGGEKRGFWGSPKTSGVEYDARYRKQREKDQKKREKALRKKYRKQAKMAEDPQYSDPMYFGHKRPPKKRKPGKKKFCKVCEMVH